MFQEELVFLWQNTGEIFQDIKKNKEIYDTSMDKNTLCVYCLNVSDNDYYQIEEAGTVCELSKRISLIEEDLSYFAKHVLIYTKAMDEFSAQYVGRFDELCREYIVEEQFEKYKENNRDNYKYDFLMDLFIKLPFLQFAQYQIGMEKEYRTVMSFVQEKARKHTIELDKTQEMMICLENAMEDNNRFYNWLDALIDQETNADETKEDEI